MNPTPIDSGHAYAGARRLPVVARVAAGLGAVAVTAVCLGSQLALVAVYSGEADTAIAHLRSTSATSQVAADTARQAVADAPRHQTH